MPNTREKLIELITERENDLVRKIAWFTDTYRIKEVADHLIANGVTFATDNNVGHKWISVKDRLPKGNKPGEISENVIVRTTDGEVTTGWLDALGSDKWWLVIGTDDSHTCWGLGYVTHWMPLPEPPKGE